MHEHVAGPRQHLAAVQQRALQRLGEGVRGPVGSLGLAVPKQAAALRIPQGREEIAHADLNQARLGRPLGHRPHALPNEAIRQLKGFLHPFLGHH